MSTFIKIGEKDYKCNTGAITPIRYRLHFGQSLSADLDADFERALFGLIYIAIEDEDKPKLVELLKYREDITFLKSGLELLDKVYKTDTKARSVEAPPDSDNDELDTLVAFADANLPNFLLHEASILQLNYIIGRYYQAKNPNKAKTMNRTELNREYGITPEMEEQINKALEAQEAQDEQGAQEVKEALIQCS